jgi:hypothetical protein
VPVIRLPPKVISATLLVAVAPLAAVWALRAAGVLDSFLACSALGAALSLGACQLAARIWEGRPGTEDVLFGDLMIWGWARRCLQQRRLDDAAATLGLRRTPGGTDPLTLSVERRAAMLERLAGDLEGGDPYTHGHSRRVARYSAMIAKRMGVGGAELARIRTAAAVHDVGKLETPTEILHKPGKLTDAEFEIVRQHPGAGAQMVTILEDEQLTSIVCHHHERLDGSGYPDRLIGDQIPLGARIVAVADTFDAITSARPYRGAKPHREALAILRGEAGTKLDRDAVGAFCSVYRGRRTLGAWIAFTDLAERMLTWLVPDAGGATARTVAIAATAAAVGGGAAALPAGASGTRGDAPQRAPVAAGPHAPAFAAAVSGSGAAGGSAARARSDARNIREPASSGLRHHVGRSGGTRIIQIGGHRGASGPSHPTSSGNGAGTGTGASTGMSNGGGGGGSAPGATDPVGADSAPAATVSATGSGAGAGAAVGSSGVHLAVGASPGSPGGGTGATVSAGSSGATVSAGSSGASAGVQVGGGSGPSASAGVTVGGGGTGDGGTGDAGASGSSTSGAPTVSVSATGGSGSGSGVGAEVNVPGVASVNLHLGG